MKSLFSLCIKVQLRELVPGTKVAIIRRSLDSCYDERVLTISHHDSHGFVHFNEIDRAYSPIVLRKVIL